MIKKINAVVLSLLFLLGSRLSISPNNALGENDEFVFNVVDETEAETSFLNQGASHNTGFEYPIAKEILEDPLDVLRLINKDHLLDNNYPPSDDLHEMVNTQLRKTSSDKLQIRKVAEDALTLLFEAAEQEGIRLYVKSAYRSYKTQSYMHYNRVESMGYDDGYVQSAGASEHQSGLSIDVVNKEWSDKKLNKQFAETEAGKWLASNCYRFGFIIRYPAGEKEAITGIAYEPWHLRFVGIEVATYMTQKGLTLEEFTEEWQNYVENPSAMEISLQNAETVDNPDAVDWIF